MGNWSLYLIAALYFVSGIANIVEGKSMPLAIAFLCYGVSQIMLIMVNK